MVACTGEKTSTSLSYPFLQISFIDGEHEDEEGHVEDIELWSCDRLKEKEKLSVVQKWSNIGHFGLDVEKANEDQVQKEIKEERVAIRWYDVEMEKSESEEEKRSSKISLKPRLSSFTDQDKDQGDEASIECACRQWRKISKSSTWSSIISWHLALGTCPLRQWPSRQVWTPRPNQIVFKYLGQA